MNLCVGVFFSFWWGKWWSWLVGGQVLQIVPLETQKRGPNFWHENRMWSLPACSEQQFAPRCASNASRSFHAQWLTTPPPTPTPPSCSLSRSLSFPSPLPSPTVSPLAQFTSSSSWCMMPRTNFGTSVPKTFRSIAAQSSRRSLFAPFMRYCWSRTQLPSFPFLPFFSQCHRPWPTDKA